VALLRNGGEVFDALHADGLGVDRPGAHVWWLPVSGAWIG
jgi:hypothetical protein